MATRSCLVHSWTNEGSKQSVNCSKAGFVSETPFFARVHFPHNDSTADDVSRMTPCIHYKLLPIRTIFFQLLSFMLASITSWWCATDIACVSPDTSSKGDHKVSRISPSTSPAPSTKLSVNFGKHSAMWAARCHFPTAPVISNDSHSSRNSDSDTRSRKWMIHWQHMS